MSQTIIAGLMVALGGHTNIPVEEGLLRHLVLNKLRYINQQFKRDYGKLVIACDGKSYWRQEVFPYYKAHRISEREKSEIDWKTVFNIISKLKDELRQYFPYTVIEHPKAEADDIIGVLCNRFGVSVNYTLKLGETPEQILIVSGDNDFVQLQKYQNVKQYNSVMKKWVMSDQPLKDLKEKILRGDRGDGIPNVLSDDDTIINPEKRQRQLRQTKIEDLAEGIGWDETVKRNYKRNSLLIDLSHTPSYIVESVNEQFDNGPLVPDRSKIYKYMITHDLVKLTDYLSDF